MQAKIVINIVQWLIRIYGGLIVGLIFLFLICEGPPPNPFSQPLPVRFEFFGMLVILTGLVVGWWKQGFGGFLIFCGIMTFHIVEKKIVLDGALPFCDVAAILYLISWWLKDMLSSDETV